MTEEVRWKLKHLPDSPGCYLMKSKGEIIYVGKAKNLKNRVKQYFQSNRGHTAKVMAMVGKVDDFDTVLVDGELEALILECNLIKKHQPYYNILLKDDKHYPYIAIDLKEPFPRVELKRRQEKDGLKYFGPYPGASIVREVLDVVRMVFPIRTCTRTITEKHQRPCVHHEIGQCLAPCAGKVNSEEYHRVIERVIEFLSGRQDAIVRELTEKMRSAAEEYNFERAAIYRDRVQAVSQVMQKQKAIITTRNDQDVIVATPEGADALVQLLYMRDGKLLDAAHFVLKNAAEEEMGDLLTSFILQHYAGGGGVIPRAILLGAEPSEKDVLETLLSEEKGTKVEIRVPARGDKYALIQMAYKNLHDEAKKRAEKLKRSFERTTGALMELQEVLGLEKLPRRIEGYDISNTQGVLSVGSMVVMLQGVSAPKEYRHFRIKTVEGPNDFESMREVITRRLKHGISERAEREEKGLSAEGGKFSNLPDLILIDGGKGQLNAALSAMAEQGLSIPMFGLAKRLEEIVLPDADESILLPRHSEALRLIQRLRDEAHRFGITHHRNLRAKKSIASVLDDIEGVGPARKKALLSHFKSIEALKKASVEEIEAAKGVTKPVARSVYDALHAK